MKKYTHNKVGVGPRVDKQHNLISNLLDSYISDSKAAESEVYRDYRRMSAIATRVEGMVDQDVNVFRIAGQCDRYLEAHSRVMNMLVKNRRWVCASFLEEMFEQVVELNAWMLETIQSHRTGKTEIGESFVNDLVRDEFFYTNHLYRYARWISTHIENVIAPDEFSDTTNEPLLIA